MEHMPWAIKGHPVCADWNMGSVDANAGLAILLRHGLRDVAARRVLQLASDAADHVFLPIEGWLAASRVDPDGARQIVDFVLPGVAFDPASAQATIAAVDVMSLGRAKVAMIPRAAWQRYLIDHPAAWDVFARQTAAGYARLAERMLRLGKSSAETRIAYAIWELCLRARPFGLTAGQTIGLPLTQQVLGEFVGLSSVHVNRTLRAMVGAGVLDYRGQIEIDIHDLSALAGMAQIEPCALHAAIIPMPC